MVGSDHGSLGTWIFISKSENVLDGRCSLFGRGLTLGSFFLSPRGKPILAELGIVDRGFGFCIVADEVFNLAIQRQR